MKDKGRRDYTLNPTPSGPTNGVQFSLHPPESAALSRRTREADVQIATVDAAVGWKSASGARRHDLAVGTRLDNSGELGQLIRRHPPHRSSNCRSGHRVRLRRKRVSPVAQSLAVHAADPAPSPRSIPSRNAARTRVAGSDVRLSTTWPEPVARQGTSHELVDQAFEKAVASDHG